VTPVTDDVLDPSQETVLDLLDHLLNKGVTLTGDVMLGVARVDLVYLRLSSLLCAADRVLTGRQGTARGRKSPARRTKGHRSRS
jgi:hypothetical protein